MGSRRRHRYKRAIRRGAKGFARWFVDVEGILFVLAVAIVVFGVYLGFSLGDLINVKIVTGVLLTIPVAALAGFVKNLFLSHAEDGLKLSEENDKLVKRYALTKLMEIDEYDRYDELLYGDDGNSKKLKLPVTREPNIRGVELVIADDGSKEYQLPDYCNKHFDDIMRCHSTSDVYSQQNIRVDSWGLEAGVFVIHTSRTAYFLSLVTNRAMDYQCNGTPTTVRELFEPGPQLHSLEKSLLSNHLGFNGFLESADEQVPLVKRDASLSIGKRTYGPSIAASLKVKYALESADCLDANGLYEAMYRELSDELKVEKDWLKSMTGGALTAAGEERLVAIVGVYRDVVEGGKPQLLIAAKSKKERGEIESHFKAVRKQKAKEAGSTFEHVIDGKKLTWVPAADICAKNIRQNEDGRYVLKTSVGKYKLTPSAAASVVLYGEYRDAQAVSA